MASNEDDYKTMQHPIEVKEEKFEVVGNEPYTSTCTDTQGVMDEFITTLSYDEIAIVKQLQKALTDANQRENKEECTNIKIEIKEEEESQCVLNHAPVPLDNLKCEEQQCSSSEPMAESNLDILIQELSSEELDQSIEIVKQLQKILVNADGNESAGEFSAIHPDVKEEKESDVVLNDSGKFLSHELRYDEMDLSIAIIEQLQKAFGNFDGTEKQGESSQSDQEIKEEKKCQSALADSLKCLEEQKYPSQDCSGKYQHSKHRYKEGKHLDQLSSNFVPNVISHFPDLIFSDIENIPKTVPCIYKNIDGIISSSIKQRNADKIVNLSPVEACLDNSNVSKEISKPLLVKETVGSRTCTGESQKCSSLSRKKRLRTSNKPFTCKTCGANFTESFNLTIHMKIHTGERPFECNSCGDKFRRHDHLKVHMRIHTGERLFGCNICGAKFSHSHNLKVHTRIHTGERPFDCNICGAKFSYSNTLKLHMRIHTGERPFECKSCGAKFTQSSHLKAHMRIHTREGPFDCKDCGAKFTQLSNLKGHMKIHKG